MKPHRVEKRAAGAVGTLAVGRLLLQGAAAVLFPALLAAQAAEETATGPSEQRLLDWTRPRFPAAEYERRREAVRAGIADSSGVILIPSAHGLSHGETFRQADDFHYLTGLEIPQSVLVIDLPTGRPTLFAPRRDFRFENDARPNDFPGRPLADDPALATVSGVGDIRPLESLEVALREWSRLGVTVHVDAGRSGQIRQVVTSLIPDWDPLLLSLYHLQSTYPGLRLANAFDAIARARMAKSALEIEAMRRSVRTTEAAIRAAARDIRDGVTERALEGSFEAGCKRNGAQRIAFAPIIKSGPNSLWPWRVLASHYDRRNRAMHDGELVIFDVGCEVDHYVSDVGRTFPVSGTFTAAQRAALEIELAVADAIVAAVRPGVTLTELQGVAEAAIPEEARPHMQTGLFFGHHIGLSTGDPGLADAPLEPGMVFTVEPWYYNHRTGISVFTEDEILVTEDGAELLTGTLPRDPDGLESLIRER